MKTLITVLALVLTACGSQADMAKSKHVYRLSANDPQLQSVLLPLQFILNSISDRLDRLESLRGTSLVQGDVGIEGTMTSGIVPLARIQRTEVTATNANSVTLTAVDGDIVSVDLGSVIAGDRILILTSVSMTKGATGGRTYLYINKSSGFAIVRLLHDHQDHVTTFVSQNVAANDIWETAFSTMALVNTGGTLTMRVRGGSAGSDSTILGSTAKLYALVLRNP